MRNMRMRPDQAELAEAARAMSDTWWDVGPICVKHGEGAYGVAMWREQEAQPIAIYLRADQPDPMAVIRDDAARVERFESWEAAAAVGWRLD